MKELNYFLADLPAGAEHSANLITEACQTLKRNRQHYLEPRSTDSIIIMIDRLAAEWLAEDSPFRQKALQEGPEAAGFSAPVLASGLDRFFKQLTIENIEAFLRQELGSSHRLDNFHPEEHYGAGKRSAIAHGPVLLAHLAPGNIPIPALTQMVLGLLTRSAQFIKCASGSSFLPRLFAHSIYEMDHKAGSCIELAEWKGGREDLEGALFAETDCVVATGSDEMLEAIAKRIPRRARLVGYGTRVSFGFISRDALEKHSESIAQKVADDVTAWNQRGCLSPHVIYVEDGGAVAAGAFAEMLAEQLAAGEKLFPRGPLNAGDSAAICTRRSFYEVRSAHSLATKMWASPESTAWTVILDNDPRFQLSCGNRFVHVKGVANLNHALQGAELVREQVSTVGLSSTPTQTADLARHLAQWGARRICPMGQMQNPPLGWRHDGRPPLGDLLTWTDWEK